MRRVYRLLVANSRVRNVVGSVGTYERIILNCTWEEEDVKGEVGTNLEDIMQQVRAVIGKMETRFVADS
jgi:hypothetical protein